MSAFQRHSRRQTGQFAHHLDERHCIHLRNECVIFRHVAHQAANVPEVGAYILSEDFGGTSNRLVEAEESVDQCRFAGAVRTEQSDGTPAKRCGQTAKDVPISKPDRKAVELNQRHGRSTGLRASTLADWCSGLCHRAHCTGGVECVFVTVSPRNICGKKGPLCPIVSSVPRSNPMNPVLLATTIRLGSP